MSTSCRHPKRPVTFTNQYCVGDHVIEIIEQLKKFDILISHGLKWSAHVSHIKANACTCCNCTLKLFSTGNIRFCLKHLLHMYGQNLSTTLYLGHYILKMIYRYPLLI